MNTSKIRLLVVDDHRLLRRALCRFIGELGICSEIFEAGDGIEALQLLSASNFDIVAMDIQMPRMNGFELVKRIRKDDLQTKIIILTQFKDESLIVHLIELGVNAFCFKNSDPSELEDVILTVQREGHFYDDHVLKVLQGNVNRQLQIADLNISPREFQVIVLLKDGLSNIEIAKKLGLTVRTIESYRKSVIKKTKCRNSADLISLAYRIGLMPN